MCVASFPRMFCGFLDSIILSSSLSCAGVFVVAFSHVGVPLHVHKNAVINMACSKKSNN